MNIRELKERKFEKEQEKQGEFFSCVVFTFLSSTVEVDGGS